MKFRHAYLILLCFLTTSFSQTKPLNVLFTGDNCQTILDSARIFVQTSAFAINTKPTITDPERNLRLDKWFQNLSFKNLTCLLNNETISLKVLGFMFATYFHRDSLLKNYSYLLTDTTAIQFFMADGSITPRMKLGELLSTMAQKSKEDNDSFAKQPEIEEKVSTFIKQYSTYPGTYKPISFPYFSISSGNEGIGDFKIHHNYEIKNNKGIKVRVVSAFVLDKKLRINIIEKDSISNSYSYSPKLKYWLKEFGRKITKNDSLTLRLR